MRAPGREEKAARHTSSSKPMALGRASSAPSDSSFHLQRTIGNQAVQRLLATNAGPARLSINTPGDPQEKEADRVADQVAAAPERSDVTGAPPHIQRSPGPPSGKLDAAPASAKRALATPAAPLQPSLRQDMERRFSHDLSSVRVHTDAAAEQSARELQAKAYAAGNHIVFGRGHYAPDTTAGRRLLAHELTHVLQQPTGEASVIRRAPGEGALPMSTSLPPASENLARLAELTNQWVPSPEKQRLTTISRAAAIEIQTGRPVHLIAVAGEGAGATLDRSVLRPDEVLVPYTGEHAEIQTMRYARQAGYRILPGALEPSRAFCTNCAWWALKENLAPPHGQVNVGNKIRPISSVTLGELSKNIAAARMPGAGGEPTALGQAKKAQRLLNATRPLGTTIMPAAPVTTPMPSPGGSPMGAHEPFRMPPAQSPMGAYEPFRMPAPGPSPMSEHHPVRMGAPSPSPMSAHEPFRMPAATGSPVTAAGPNRITGGQLAGGMLKGVAVNTLVGLAVMGGLKLAWSWLAYEKNVQSEEERQLRELFGKGVEPGVTKALEAQSAKALQMTTDHPEFPVYANVTVDLVKNWTETGVAGNPTDKEIVEATFVDLDVSFKKVSKEETRDSYHSLGNYYATSRVTYFVEIDFGETKEERQWRTLVRHAGSIVRRNMSARSVAEHTHWGGIALTPVERLDDEERRKWGDPTLAEQRAYDERELWVLAYIEYAAMHGPDDQYSAALKYLEEIRRRPRPAPGQVLRRR